ncbi:hypothetical protein MTO96_008367 [Rhipicephalus appendiculatus]
MVDALADLQVDLAADGRCDSPGYSAKYLRYSVLAIQNGCILHTEQVQLGESPEVRNSVSTEKQGLAKCLTAVENLGINISSLNTENLDAAHEDVHAVTTCLRRDDQIREVSTADLRSPNDDCSAWKLHSVTIWGLPRFSLDGTPWLLVPPSDDTMSTTPAGLGASTWLPSGCCATAVNLDGTPWLLVPPSDDTMSTTPAGLGASTWLPSGCCATAVNWPGSFYVAAVWRLRDGSEVSVLLFGNVSQHLDRASFVRSLENLDAAHEDVHAVTTCLRRDDQIREVSTADLRSPNDDCSAWKLHSVTIWGLPRFSLDGTPWLLVAPSDDTMSTTPAGLGASTWLPSGCCATAVKAHRRALPKIPFQNFQHLYFSRAENLDAAHEDVHAVTTCLRRDDQIREVSTADLRSPNDDCSAWKLHSVSIWGLPRFSLERHTLAAGATPGRHDVDDASWPGSFYVAAVWLLRDGSEVSVLLFGNVSQHLDRASFVRSLENLDAAHEDVHAVTTCLRRDDQIREVSTADLRSPNDDCSAWKLHSVTIWGLPRFSLNGRPWLLVPPSDDTMSTTPAGLGALQNLDAAHEDVHAVTTCLRRDDQIREVSTADLRSPNDDCSAWKLHSVTIWGLPRFSLDGTPWLLVPPSDDTMSTTPAGLGASTWLPSGCCATAVKPWLLVPPSDDTMSTTPAGLGAFTWLPSGCSATSPSRCDSGGQDGVPEVILLELMEDNRVSVSEKSIGVLKEKDNNEATEKAVKEPM